MQIIQSRRQTLRLFTPVLGILSIARVSKLAGDLWGFSPYGLEPRDIFVLLLFPVSLLLGNFYCGWFCPAGLMQRFLYFLGSRLLGKDRQKKWSLSKKNEQGIRYVRNVILAAWSITLVLTPLGLVSVETAYFVKVSPGMGLIAISLKKASQCNAAGFFDPIRSGTQWRSRLSAQGGPESDSRC